MIKFKEIDKTMVEEVLSKVSTDSRTKESNCLLFPYVNGGGYAQLQINNQHVLVHRLIKSFFSGKDIKDGLVVHHTCNNKNCVNPNHLKVMTQAEHNKLHKTRLTDKDLLVVVDTYFNSNLTLKELSYKLKQDNIFISYSYISKLVNGLVRQDIINKYNKGCDDCDGSTSQ